jgi:hypothetical protein
VDDEIVIGVDFAGPRTASGQRRKIVALSAVRLRAGEYRVSSGGFNGRILSGAGPGWTAAELAEALTGGGAARVVAFDFPFSIPKDLLDDPAFAAAVGRPVPFVTWAEFNGFVARALPLGSPLDLGPFAGWRTKGNWRRRATDVAAAAQPPLKDRFQVLFNMTLLGNALLARLEASGRYRIVPFGVAGPAGEVIEVYPGLTMRGIGRRDYKRDPVGAVAAVLGHCAEEGIRIAVDPQVRQFCETYNTGGRSGSDPDGSDALIALATAILYREGRCVEAIAPPDQDRRSVEGAIWRPADRSQAATTLVGRQPSP